MPWRAGHGRERRRARPGRTRARVRLSREVGGDPDGRSPPGSETGKERREWAGLGCGNKWAGADLSFGEEKKKNEEGLGRAENEREGKELVFHFLNLIQTHSFEFKFGKFKFK